MNQGRAEEKYPKFLTRSSVISPLSSIHLVNPKVANSATAAINLASHARDKIERGPRRRRLNRKISGHKVRTDKRDI